ncbi:MAG: polysaccharide biosynthesis C-terminal domain-containing protein, partial [Candidatus Dormibacteraceae bacterium]
VLGRMYQQRERGVEQAVTRFAKALCLLGWPLTVGGFLLAPGFRFVYNYAGSEPALRILSLGIIFMFLNNAFIVALNAIDRQSSFTWAAFWSMLINVALNLMLIPLFGYIGASWATVLTEVALAILGWVLTARHLTRLPLWHLTWKTLLAGLIMGAALIPFRDVSGPLLMLVIAGGAVIYALGLLALKALDDEEWGLLRQALRINR